MFADFFSSLYAMAFGNVVENRMIWTLGGSKIFSVHSYYKALRDLLMIIAFLGIVFGNVRFLTKLLLLFGLRPLGESPPLTI